MAEHEFLFPVCLDRTAARALPSAMKRYAGHVYGDDGEARARLIEAARAIWEASEQPGDTVAVELTMDHIRLTQPALRLIAAESLWDETIDERLFRDADRAMEDAARGRVPALLPGNGR